MLLVSEAWARAGWLLAEMHQSTAAHKLSMSLQRFGVKNISLAALTSQQCLTVLCQSAQSLSGLWKCIV